MKHQLLRITNWKTDHLRQVVGVCCYIEVLYVMNTYFMNEYICHSNKWLVPNALKILWCIEISWFTQKLFSLKPDWRLLLNISKNSVCVISDEPCNITVSTSKNIFNRVCVCMWVSVSMRMSACACVCFR